LTPDRRLAVVVSGFPRRSETFALAELCALEEMGCLEVIFSTKPGEAGATQPDVDRLRHRVRLLSGDPASQAAEAARFIGATRVAGVHAYFAHTPAEVALGLAVRLDVRFGFSVHARDARKIPRSELHSRAQRAACVIACNTDVTAEFAGSGARVQVVPHGIDLRRFAPAPTRERPDLRLLAVGRLVPKKGFDVLLDALSCVHVPWRLRLVGDGPERVDLVAKAARLGLLDRVSFCGAMTHDDLPLEYRDADVVIVPSVRDASGDCDGLPNVLLEAMATGRAVVASNIGATASAIRDGGTGILVPAGDATVLASVLSWLAGNPARRSALGAAARRAAELHFDVSRCTRRFAAVLQDAYA
jgi:glycosyltransferase involved in cell wall biosynthesis